jgi:AraC-like DNA-binding protein
MIKLRDFIEQNMSDSELGVENIGAELGLSRVQLYRKVKALTGQSPVELLRTARLHKARRLLQESDKSISEVAYEVGFTSPSYFTKCFKDEFGVSPSELIS